jgi:hypothetical protein
MTPVQLAEEIVNLVGRCLFEHPHTALQIAPLLILYHDDAAIEFEQ